MKALYFPAHNSVEVGELPDPVAGPGEVVIGVHSSGLCHTDIEVMRGNYGSSAFPIVPGHEYAGEVLELGAGVTGLSVGDRVAVDPNIACGNCGACKRDWVHLCESLGAYGVTENGGFAEKSVVRADHVHPLGDLSFELAALAEPMGCALNGLSPLKDRLIERALIFGSGPMGLLMGMALKARGTEEVLMVDLDEDRLRMTEEQGLKGVMSGTPDVEKLRHACDLAVDATGVPAVAGSLIDYAANGGSVLFFGVCAQDARIEISPFEVFRRQLSLFGTHSLNHNIPEAIATIRDIGPRAEKLVTHQLQMEEIAHVMSGKKLDRSMKVQLAL